MEPSGPRALVAGLSSRVWLAAVLLVTFAAYAPSLGNGFSWDDKFFAKGSHEGTVNPMVGEPRPLTEYWQRHLWHGRAETSRAYRPTTVLSYALRHRIAGDDARVAHALNVALHLLCVWLAYLLLLVAGSPARGALIGAAVFGLHAIHSEAVANVTGRAELLGFALGAGATVVFFTLRRRRGLSGIVGHGIVALLLFLAFGAKENALAWAPFIGCVAAVRRWPTPAGTARERVWAAACVVVPLLAYGALRAGAMIGLPDGDPTTTHLENPLIDAPFATRAMTGTLVWGLALLLNVLPFRLSADYGSAVLPVVEGPASPAFALFLLAALVLLTLLAVGVVSARRYPLLFVATACFFGFSFIVTNIPAPVLMMLGERTYYTPSLALSFVIAWLALRPRLAAVAPVVLGAWLGASTLVVLERNAVFRDDVTLIETEVRRQPRSARMQLLAGLLHLEAGRAHAALHHFRQAVTLDPGHADSWNQLGRALLALDRPERATEAFQHGFDARPAEVTAISDRLWANTGRAHAARGDRAAALEAFARSFVRNPRRLRGDPSIRGFLVELMGDIKAPRELRQRAADLGRRIYASPGR